MLLILNVPHCRGIRLGASLGAIEVVVKSKVDSQVAPDEHSDESSSQEGETVFLHLKKFFRGARFTNPWFLNKMAAKFPLHAQVAVGGKVCLLASEKILVNFFWCVIVLHH